MDGLRSAKDAAKGTLLLPLLILFVISAATLGFEILLTRVFAIVLFASHSFVAISLAMLGTGAGALAAHILGGKTRSESHKLLMLALFGALVLIAVWVCLSVEFVPQEVIDADTGELVDATSFNERKRLIADNPDLMQTWKLYAVLPVVFAPFMVSGYLQALLFREALDRFGLFYGVDLLGATVGSVGIPLLLYPLGLTGAVYSVAFISMLPALFAAWKRLDLRRGATIGVALLVGTVVFVEATGSLEIRFTAGFAEKDVKRKYWSPMARIGVLEIDDWDVYLIDNTSRTWYAPYNAQTIERFADSLYTVPMELKSGGSALIIASGGGQEISMAHHYKMSHIDAVEIAGPIIEDALTARADDPTNPYLFPEVTPHKADGRSVAMRADRKYDVIQMKEVNFWTMASQISQVWSPYFIFTQEAFAEYFSKLEDEGLLCYTTYDGGNGVRGTSASRRFGSMIAGLRLAGVKHPEDHLLIAQRPFYHANRIMVVARKTPWDETSIREFEQVLKTRGRKHELMYPVRTPETQSKKARKAAEYAHSLIPKVKPRPVTKNWRIRTDSKKQRKRMRGQPITDDQPYLETSGLFAQLTEFGSVIAELYLVLLGTLSAIVVVFIVVPFALRGRRRREGRKSMPLRLVGILAATGLGFMFVEMAAIFRFQLYLHHPTIAMIVVLSSMILGAGIGSLHSERVTGSRERSTAVYALLGLVVSAIVLLGVPVWGHRALLAMPMPLVVISIFGMMALLGFLLGHVVPLSMKHHIGDTPQLVPYAWALTVTGSVYGAVAASILSRELGMTYVALLGLGCYAGATVIAGAGAWWTARRGAVAAPKPTAEDSADADDEPEPHSDSDEREPDSDDSGERA